MKITLSQKYQCLNYGVQSSTVTVISSKMHALPWLPAQFWHLRLRPRPLSSKTICACDSSILAIRGAEKAVQKITMSEIRPLILVFAAFALVALIIQSFGSLCPDVSWINYGTGQLLSGKTLYRDIVEVNPPIIYFISMPPLFLANALGFADSKMFFLVWIVLLCFGSTILLWAILSPLRQTSPREKNALLLGYMACGLILVGESFGQIGRAHV